MNYLEKKSLENKFTDEFGKLNVLKQLYENNNPNISNN
jgi:hypothetical protein